MNDKFSNKPFRSEDVQIIAEEVAFLMRKGYRAHQKDQILEGLYVALEGSPMEDWRRWTGMRLHQVIDDLFYLGTP